MPWSCRKRRYLAKYRRSLFLAAKVLFSKGFQNRLKLMHIWTHYLVIPRTSLFSQISQIAILGTQGVIFQKMSESAEINAHKRLWPSHAKNFVIRPNRQSRLWAPKVWFSKGWRNWLKLSLLSPHGLLMPNTSLFGQISTLAILGTQCVIFKRLAESVEINAHMGSWPGNAENVVSWPNRAIAILGTQGVIFQ